MSKEFQRPMISIEGKLIKAQELTSIPKWDEMPYYADDPSFLYHYDYILKFFESDIFTLKEFVKKVYFNEPYTIVIWLDGTKTIVKCTEGCKYDKYTGLTTCFLKKLMGDYGFSQFKKLTRNLIKEDE